MGFDVAYVPTPKVVVREMLRLAGLRKGETLVDLGAGDGRVLIEAAREFGAKPIGIEVDPERIARIKERLESTGVQAELIQDDFMKVNLSKADVIVMYLSDSANARLAQKLRRELNPGTRIVSLDYVLPGWVPDKESTAQSGRIQRRIYLYSVPK